MKKLHLVTTLCICVFVQPVIAGSITSTITNGNSVIDWGSSTGAIDLDVEFNNQQSVQINFNNTGAIQDSVFINIFNNTGVGWSGFTFDLTGVGFTGPLDVAPATGILVNFEPYGNDPDTGLATGVFLSFDPLEYTALYNVVGVIDTTYVQEQTYSLIMTPTAVPLPAAAWLFASGLLGLTGMAHRRKKIDSCISS